MLIVPHRYPLLTGPSNNRIGINPQSLSNLEVYLRSDQISGNHGDSIPSWPDLSPHFRTFVQSTAAQQPTLQKTSNLSPNGKPLVRFSGAAVNPSEMNFTFGSGNYPSNTAGNSFYFYANWFSAAGGGSGGQVPFSDDTNGRPQLISDEAGAGIRMGWRTTEDTNPPSTTKLGGAYSTGIHITSWIFRGTPGVGSGYIYQSNILQETDTWNWNSGIPVEAIVGAGPDTVPQQFDLGAFLWFSIGHDEPTRMGIEAYLTNFFG